MIPITSSNHQWNENHRLLNTGPNPISLSPAVNAISLASSDTSGSYHLNQNNRPLSSGLPPLPSAPVPAMPVISPAASSATSIQNTSTALNKGQEPSNGIAVRLSQDTLKRLVVVLEKSIETEKKASNETSEKIKAEKINYEKAEKAYQAALKKKTENKKALEHLQASHQAIAKTLQEKEAELRGICAAAGIVLNPNPKKRLNSSTPTESLEESSSPSRKRAHQPEE